MPQPLINGESYSWSQMSVDILGTEVSGITAIKYADKQDIENNYGAGSNIVSRGKGNIEPEASITLYMTEVEALQAAAKGGSLYNIPAFDIAVSYVTDSGIVVNHTIKNCLFKNNGRDVKQNDKSITTELELACSHIIWK